MSEFANVGYWWLGSESECADGPAGRMHARSLPVVLPCDDLHGPPTKWRKDYQAIIVHHFPRGAGCLRRIRKHHPHALIVLRLDRAPEVTNKPGMFRYWPRILRDMRQADVIADALPDNRHAEYWARITGTRAMPLPSPILPHPELDRLRSQKRDDFIMCLDHKADPRFPAPSLVAAAYVQRKTGCKVVIAKPQDDYVRELARELGLNAEFIPQLDHPALLALIARARLVIDLYTMHTPGRINALAAWVGTPSVGSLNSPELGYPRVDPWSGAGADMVLHLMTDEAAWRTVRNRGIEAADRQYAPEAIRDAMRAIMKIKVEAYA